MWEKTEGTYAENNLAPTIRTLVDGKNVELTNSSALYSCMKSTLPKKIHIFDR